MNVTTTTTPAETVAPTGSPKPRRTKLLVAGVGIAALVAAGGVAVGLAGHTHGPSTQFGQTAAGRQAGLVKAERLQGQVDARAAVGDVLDQSAQQAALTKAERLQDQADARTAGVVLDQSAQQAALTKAERLQDQADARTAGVVLDQSAQQAALTKAERLQDQADARTADPVTGGGAAAQQARTRLNHELRNSPNS
jgi:hypothetical protein